MLEQNQCVTDWSVKNNSKDKLSEKIRWYFKIFANQFRTIQFEKWFGRENDSSSTALTVSCIFLKLAWTYSFVNGNKLKFRPCRFLNRFLFSKEKKYVVVKSI